MFIIWTTNVWWMIKKESKEVNFKDSILKGSFVAKFLPVEIEFKETKATTENDRRL